MDFDEIVLTSEQLEALKAVSKNSILLTRKNQKTYYFLRNAYGFVEIIAYFDEGSEKSPFRIPKAVLITELGSSYLEYFRNKRKDSSKSSHHDYLVAIVSAVCGSLFTFLVDHHSDVVRFFDIIIDNWLK